MSRGAARPNPKKFPFNYVVSQTGVPTRDFETYPDAEAYITGRFPELLIDDAWRTIEGPFGSRTIKLCLTAA